MMTAATTRTSGASRKTAARYSHELSDLLYPMTPEEFTSQYWGRQPVFIKGSPDKLEKLFPGGFKREDFVRAVHDSVASKAKGFILYGVRGQSPENAESVLSKGTHLIEPEEIDETLANGESVTVTSLREERLVRFVSAIKAQLNHAGEITLDSSLSPPRQGFPSHIDPISNIFIQTEGRKSYWVSKTPVLQWPRANALITRDGQGVYVEHVAEEWEEITDADQCSLVEIVMEPGDMLYIPAGTIHPTKSHDEYSLNVILIFRHANFLDLVNQTLAESLAHDPAWRHLPHVCVTGTGGGEPPEEARAFFAERLIELREMVNALTPDSLALNRHWHKMIADPGEVTRASLSLTASKEEERPVERQDVLRLSRKAPITFASGVDDEGVPCMSLFFVDKEISVGGEWTPFLQNLVEQDEFTAESAARWSGASDDYPWATVQEYLQALLDQNIIERAAHIHTASN